MIDNPLSFLFDLFDFFDFLNEGKVILVDFWRRFLHFDFRHVLNILDLVFIVGLLFCVRLVAYYAAFWPRRHERSIWVYLLLDFDFLYRHLLLNDRFFGDKVLQSMGILDG